MTSSKLTRRRFLNRSLVGAGLLAAASRSGLAIHPAQGRSPFGEVVAETPFARVEKLAEGVWAVISTPFKPQGGFGDMTTVCNGGFMAGSQGVLVVDTFQRPAGAAWVAEQALRLTGKHPTHVVITHFHADHSGGTAGFQLGAEGPEILATETTRRLIWERYQTPRSREGEKIPRVSMRYLAPTSVIPDATQGLEIDLGGRSVRIELRSGHTPSDLTVMVDDPPIVFDGDLVWKDIVPNFRDSTPSMLWRTCRELLADPETIHVAGHGDAARTKDLGDYLVLLEVLEKAARQAHASGKSASQAAAGFKPPQSLKSWILPNPAQYRIGFEAWYRELGAI